MSNTKPGTGQESPPKDPSVDDRPQHEDEYLSKFLQTPTPENKGTKGKEAEPVNKSSESKPGQGQSGDSKPGEGGGVGQGNAGEGKADNNAPRGRR